MRDFMQRRWQLSANTLVPFSFLLFLPFSLRANFHSNSIHSRLLRLPNLALPITIVIPVFNRQEYLSRAITSALNQSLANVEVLIVDDASSDHSSDIAASFEKSDHRVRVVRLSANAGTHKARMTGVEQARGAYILSLDADDILMPYIAEDSLRLALIHDCDVVEFQCLEVVDGVAKLFTFFNPPSVMPTHEDLIECFRNNGLNWNLWKRLIKRSVYLQALGVFPLAVKVKKILYAEDKLHFGTILLFSKTYYFLKEVGYVYFRDNPENSESGVQQTKKETLRQLRYVERGLKSLYRTLANVSYNKRVVVPAALANLAKKGLEPVDVSQ
jgi:glycosyltransferase involved in cell wall biosynthesis